MQLAVHYGTAVSRPFVGYTMKLSAKDTYDWAHRTGSKWPCSQLSDNRCVIVVDANGLCDFTLNGDDADIDCNELEAIISDKLPKYLRHLWPTYQATGQK